MQVNIPVGHNDPVPNSEAFAQKYQDTLQIYFVTISILFATLTTFSRKNTPRFLYDILYASNG